MAEDLKPPAWLDEADEAANDGAPRPIEPGSPQLDHELEMLPFDTEAEDEVLAALLDDAGAHLPLLERHGIAPADGAETFRRVLEAVLDLRQAGGPTNHVAVAGWLRDRERLAQVGGIRKLTELHATGRTVFSVGHVEHFVLRLRRAADARRLKLALQAADARRRAGDDPGEVVRQLQETLVPLAAPKPRAQRFRVLEAAAIWAPRPPIQYLVAGIFPRGTLAMVCATGSSLKTWASLDLLTSRARGTDWLGRFSCEPGLSLFVDWESGEDELCRRLVRLSSVPVDGVALVCMPDLFFNSDDFEAVVAEWAKTYGLIVFDSLAAGTVDVDENDARFAQGLRVLKRVAAISGAVFVVLHHSRKGRTDGEAGGDERDMPRGTSANFAAVDVLLQLTRAADGAFQVRQTKARGGKSVPPFILRVDDLDERTTVVLASDVATAEEAAETQTAQRFTEVKAKIVRLVANEKDVRSASEIHRRVRGTRATVLEAVKELEERGTLVKHEGSYRLSSEVSS